MKRSGQENGCVLRSEMQESSGTPGVQESRITENGREARHESGVGQTEKPGQVPVLEALEVKKRYPGVDALDGVSFTVEEGKVVGLLGPNGSGKSTFMRIAAGQTRPRSGKVLIKGLEPGLQTRKLISYVPEYDHLYNWMKVEESVDFFAAFFPGFSRERVGEMMEFMKIPWGKKISTLSRGMRTRLKLVIVESVYGEIQESEIPGRLILFLWLAQVRGLFVVWLCMASYYHLSREWKNGTVALWLSLPVRRWKLLVSKLAVQFTVLLLLKLLGKILYGKTYLKEMMVVG